ncbi:hypothetical protein BaRGS_00028555 [Batillaria attramentaria]|uniref:Zinc finger PHD-type domain-containing protein n=1 Tax=Batillaria attramentaria TaxID=370345 RepID=A0ABD0JYF8_9CAEN
MPHLCGTAGPRKYMCGCCGEDCLYDGVFCDGCETWRHIACERIGVKELQTFKELPPDFPYICVACRTDSRGSFSFDESIKRLNKAAKQGYEKLESSVIRESLFIKNKLSASRTKAADPKVDTQPKP